MSLKESLALELGTAVPAFSLPDPFGNMYNSAQLLGEKGLLIIITCNHCPYAKAVWPRVVRLANFAREKEISTVAINPNIHPDYPEDQPEKMKEKIHELDIKFPYLIDETQETARALKAQCTPDIYLFDKDKKLVYHGRIDDNWKDESAVSREELKEAITRLAEGRPPIELQYPSIGCSIKWQDA